jgi:DNA-binding MarR family transcriptional regulator
MGSKGRQAVNAEWVADRLHSAAIHLLRRLRAEDAASGISPSRLSALSVIVFGGPVTVGELAEREQVQPPTISRMVRTRSADPNDARVQWLSATPLGRRLLERGRARRVAKLARDLRELSPAERRTLAHAVEVLEGISRPREGHQNE